MIESLAGAPPQSDAIAYVYFEHDLGDLASAPVNILWAILKQLVSRQSCISSTMHSFYDMNKDQEAIGRHDLTKLLKDECSGFPRVFVILDALDRGEENVVKKVIEDLKAVSATTRVLKILASSLNMPSFGNMLDHPKPVDFRPDQDDINHFIDKQIDDSASMERYVRKDPSLRQTIINVVSEKAHDL